MVFPKHNDKLTPRQGNVLEPQILAVKSYRICSVSNLHPSAPRFTKFEVKSGMLPKSTLILSEVLFACLENVAEWVLCQTSKPACKIDARIAARFKFPKLNTEDSLISARKPGCKVDADIAAKFKFPKLKIARCSCPGLLNPLCVFS